jgi:hypothetical protein
VIGSGILWSAAELHDAIVGDVSATVFDDSGTADITELLAGVAETDFAQEQLASALSHSASLDDWRVGEAIAETYLTEHHACSFPWPDGRDERNSGTWGVSALSRVSGIDFEALSDQDRRRINAIPAMIYHGVKTEAGVVMRMNSAPRSAAEKLGEIYESVFVDSAGRYSVGGGREFLKGLEVSDWQRVRPEGAAMSGSDYKRVWQILSGESR